MFHNLRNCDSHLIFQEIGKYNFKIDVISKTIEIYISFSIKQPKKKDIKPGLPLSFIESIHFLNDSLDNLVKNLGENDFYNLNQEFNVNVLDLFKKKDFFVLTTGIALKMSKKAYAAKINFIMH